MHRIELLQFWNHYWLNIQFQVSFESCVYKQICVQTCEWECELSLLGNKRCFKVLCVTKFVTENVWMQVWVAFKGG